MFGPRNHGLSIEFAVVILFAYTASAGQAVISNVGNQNSHVHGSVRSTNDDSPLANARVSFEGQLSASVNTDRAGAYEIELPAGTYTMTVEPPGVIVERSGFRYPTYHRGLFRVAPKVNITIDVSFPSKGTVGCEIGGRLGDTKPEPDEYLNA
jgi:hypothetical protein